MKISNLVPSPLFAILPPKCQCWKNCTLGRSKGMKNILAKAKGKHVSINVILLNYVLSTLSLSKAVDHQSLNYLVKEGCRIS